MRIVAIAATLAVVVVAPAFAGGVEEAPRVIGPEAPMLGKGALGLNGLAILEVALPAEYSYNPAILPWALREFQEEDYAEIDRGVVNFRWGPRVQNWWQVYCHQLKPGSAFRLARYAISSTSEEIAYWEKGPKVSFSGETYEVAYGKMGRRSGWGIALVPFEKVNTFICNEEGINLGRGEARSHTHLRLGGVFLPSSKVSLGLVYTFDRNKAKTVLLPPLAEGWTELDGRYTERLWTVGAGLQPRKGTAAFAAWQQGRIKGVNLSERINLLAFGVNQFLTSHLAIRVGVYDRTPGYALIYYHQGWNAGISYSRGTYRRTEKYLGRADDTAYLWVGKSF